MAKKCRACKERFEPYNSLQVACSPKCALDYARQQKQEKWDKETRRRKREMNANDRRHQIKKLQDEFNEFIRLRDAELPCISCGRTEVEWTRGGQWDAGHFRSRGACPELRFNEFNVHKQCKSCNGGSGKFARKNHTVSQEFEERLVERIGQAAVDWLKGPHEPQKYTLDEIKEMRKEYREKTRELKRRTEAA